MKGRVSRALRKPELGRVQRLVRDAVRDAAGAYRGRVDAGRVFARGRRRAGRAPALAGSRLCVDAGELRRASDGASIGAAAASPVAGIRPRSVPPAGDPLDMSFTCFNVHCMTTMIQIRNVPDALHRRLKSRAALAGMSLSDYPLGEIPSAS